MLLVPPILGLAGFAPAKDKTPIFTYSSLVGSFDNANLQVTGPGMANTGMGSFTINGSSLTWTAVPEPTSALAGLLLTTGLLCRRR